VTKRTTKKVAQELERIRSVDGVLRPERVVDAARRETSPLHDLFTWDNTEAARQFRLLQARNLIRVTVTILPGETTPTRAYVSLWSDRENEGGGYRAIAEVLSAPESRERFLREALAELSVFQVKYRRLKELSAVFAATEKVKARLGREKGGTSRHRLDGRAEP
jgi:hypothetical protein